MSKLYKFTLWVVGIAIICTILMVFISKVGAQKSEKEPIIFKNVNFVKCYDADTCTFKKDGQAIKVRFKDVDSPEVNPKQRFGKEAKDQVIMFFKTHSKKITVTCDNKRSYNRQVCDIDVDGVNVQEWVVLNGLAWDAYDVENPKKYNYSKGKYQSLQNYAKLNNKGLWKHDNPLKPWNFRKLNKKQRQKLDK